MKKIINTLLAGTIVAGGSLVAANTWAEDEVPPGYVQTPTSSAVKDSSGDCVRTPLWTKEVPCVKPVEVVQEQPAPPPPPPPPPPKHFSLGAKTLFDFDKATLRPEGKQALEALVSKWRQGDVTKLNITVTGHTDSVGTEQYNQALSERRAAAVRDYLVETGINPANITSQGMGESSPVASNATAAGRQQNRRVDIDVQGLMESQ